MDPNSYLSGENAAYLEGLEGGPAAPAWTPPSIFHGSGAPAVVDFSQAERQAKVARLINAYRVHGHLAAQIDPLGTSGVIGDYPELNPSFYELTAADMAATVSTSPLHGMPPFATVGTILERLRQAYCGSVGVEFMNMLVPEAKTWVQERFERTAVGPSLDRAEQVRVLDMLTRADGFERFLHTKFMGNKRFSLEGAESLIPLLDLCITAAARTGVAEAVIGMAHRGRLNVLVNILQKPPAIMLSEFAAHDAHTDEPEHSGDVKYHLGYSSDAVTPDGNKVHLSLAFNPSHLEAVNPVVEGRVRAKLDRIGDTEGRQVLPILIHGDAALAGQGLNQEVLNLSGLEGYRTGGTIHIVINNQIGFTTPPKDARSTPYCTGIARMLGIPIFHVNGEDPETLARIVQIAMEWRALYHRDVVIDMYCFRKWGHNETDEPSFTQPVMYKRIAEHAGVRETYLRTLIERNVVTREEAETLQTRFAAELDTALHTPPAANGKADSPLMARWASYHAGPPDQVDTTAPKAELSRLLRALNRVPADFHVHPKLQRLFKLREEQAAGEKPLDWAAGELLAYATLVGRGTRVRLSGQDAKRGTFSHRHAVLFDYENGTEHCALNHLEPRQAPFQVYNSLLSEFGVLGFEFGYSLDYPDALVLWEAQFGDFANGAQVIIDNFLVSAHAKWNRLSGLVMLLPHGYEGQGPEHSSARMERFLQMGAQENIQCVNATTPAQLFHLFRRQVMRKMRAPLVVFTPKSLLRHPAAVSSLDELATGGFQTVIGDGEGKRRVVLCSGKVYYDLLAARTTGQTPDGSTPREFGDVALVRVEELYPFPVQRVREELAKHPGAKVVWCQEEPKNMGPWPTVALELLDAAIPVTYAGRSASASPATGYPKRHALEQAALVAAALGGYQT